jgi:Flp pilus assembly protein TadB
MTSMDQVQIAGVPWPRYKLVALVIGLIVFAVVGVVTMNPASAVLLAAGTSTIFWLTFSLRRPRR